MHNNTSYPIPIFFPKRNSSFVNWSWTCMQFSCKNFHNLASDSKAAYLQRSQITKESRVNLFQSNNAMTADDPFRWLYTANSSAQFRQPADKRRHVMSTIGTSGVATSSVSLADSALPKALSSSALLPVRLMRVNGMSESMMRQSQCLG